ATFTGGGNFNGHISLFGEIQPFGNPGSAGQVLSSEGNGTMKWEYPEKLGQIIEVSPENSDTTALREMGYSLVGSQQKVVSKSGINLGNAIPPANGGLYFDKKGEMFYVSSLNKIFVVPGNSQDVYSFDLNDAAYGSIQTFPVPDYNLNIEIPIFTGDKILIYPHFIFNCITGSFSTFPSNPCPSITNTKSQVWAGTKLVLYGPTGGFTFDPATNIYFCFEHPNGNFYYPGCSTTWTGNQVIFYGGIIFSSGDTVSVDYGFLYNPSSNIWSEVAIGGPQRHNHLGLWTGSELLVIGGRLDETGFVLSDIDQIYNPVTYTWNAGHIPSSALLLTNSLTKGILANNKIFFFNHSSYEDYSNIKIFNKYFNATTLQWISYTPVYIHQNLKLFTLPVKVNTDIHYYSSKDDIVCGSNGANQGFGHIMETNTPPYIMPAWNANIFNETKKESNNQYVLVFGNLNAAWLYNADKNKWQKTTSTNLPSDRTGYGMKAISGSSNFMVWGGKNGSNFYNDGTIYYAASNIWSVMQTANAPSPRENHNLAMSSTDAMVWGGNMNSTQYYNGKIYNIATNIWNNVSTVNAPTVQGNLEWYVDKFIHVSTNGCKFYLPGSNTWVNGNPQARPGVWTGKYLVNINNFYDPGTDMVKPLDKTELNVHQTVGYVIRVYDEDNIVFIEDYFGSLGFAEVLNLTTCTISYLPLKQAFHENANIMGEIFKIPTNKRLLFSRLKSQSCPGFIEESIQRLDNTSSPTMKNINIKSLVYRRK
ncbi:MAG: hypothetical protein H7X99_01475, partial [Saprospiraceae bacterium]|nr:hypothetical protein [Saprospiraceae bacterium]